MATLFNNTEITNAFFNGTELDKIYFNGVLVFEKGGKYLRRIMVGDDLRGKNIYMDSITSKEIQETYNNYGIWIENYYNIIEASDFSIQDIYREHWEGMSEYPPSYEIETWEGRFIEYDKDLDKITIINNKITVPNDPNENYIVTSIDRRMESSPSPVSNDNHKTYRHFFIEDENIRPLEVGDVITSTTKFYFTFPDDFYGYIENNISPGERLKIVELDNSIGGKFISVENYQGITSTFYLVAFFVNNSSTSDRHIYNYNTNSSFINKSNMTSAFSGTVTNVNKNNQSYQHILVDTTTLGA